MITCCTTSAAPAQRPAKKQARANARACFDRVSLIPVPVPCAPVCNPVYKIVFPCSFPGVFFSFTQKSRSVCRSVPPMQLRRRAQSAQKQTLFRIIFGEHLVYRFFFFGTDAAARPCCRLLGQIRWRAFCRKCGPPPLFGLQVPALAAAFGQPAGTAPTPSLYTARPICWLTFPLGSDTISIKHRKGRPAPWPSS